MLKHVPYIYLFRVHINLYFYDTNTNGIFQISNRVYEYLNSIHIDIKQDSLEALWSTLECDSQKYIENLLAKGFLKEVPKHKQIEHFESDYLDCFFKDSMCNLTLQVTQNCNLRCQYCVYSGSYINRVHNKKRMSWAIAKSAIELLFNHSSASSHVTIGFYGGEPLLEWDLIVRSVEFAETLFLEKELLFTMTSNVTLLQDYMIEFICNHNIRLTISLDGPMDIQNKNRTFANGEVDTFSVVMDKLKIFEKINPNYLKANVSFNAVMDLDENITLSNDFFASYETVKHMTVAGNYINQTNKLDVDISMPRFYAESQYELFKAYLYYNTDILKEYSPKLFFSVINGLKRTFSDRSIMDDSHRSIATAAGQCLPGLLRFFVTADGKFVPCERVNEESEDLCLGNIESGINVENAKKILNIPQITADECKSCWCIKLCGQCVAKALDEDGRISKQKRIECCENSKRSAVDSMKTYITLKRYGFDFDSIERKESHV